MITTTTERSKLANFFLILLLGALNAITPFSIDMYLPAFPQIAAELHTTTQKVALSISSYFIGFALGQILYGPLLDRFGRKKPLYIGLGIYIIASIGCMSATTIEQLLLFRFIQALGGCVASVAAVSMVRDFFPLRESAKILSLLILILGVSPLLAPTIGSFVVDATSWQWVFGLLAGITAAILLLTFLFLPEGHQPDTSISLMPRPMIASFAFILREPQFYVYALAGSLAFSGLFVYVAGSPAIFMDGYHVSAKIYGGIFALLSVGFIGGSQLNHIFTRYFSNDKIFKAGVTAQVIITIIFFTGAYNNWYGLIPTMVCLFFALLCVGLTNPNAVAIALAPFSSHGGRASALIGFMQIGAGALASAGTGMLNYSGSLPTATVMVVSSSLALIILLWGKKRITKMVVPEEKVVEIM